MRINLSFILIYFLSFCYSQEFTDYKHIFFQNYDHFTQTPKLASFNTNVKYPDVNSTGMIDIRIPLYSLSDFDVVMDISLSYNPNRLKVDNASSWIGAGWSLDVGGFITRQVMDKPDDVGFLFRDPWRHLSLARIPNISPVSNFWLNGKALWGFDIGDENYIKNYPDAWYWTDQYSEELLRGWALNHFSYYNFDKEPDIYSVNVGNDSFKFVFNENGEPKFIEGFNDYKIEYTQEGNNVHGEFPEYHLNERLYLMSWYDRGIKEFRIISPEGTTYIFEENGIEYTTRYLRFLVWLRGVTTTLESEYYTNELVLKEIETPPFATTWNLTKIISPNNHILNLNYADYSYEEISSEIIFVGACRNGVDCSDDERFHYNPRQMLDEVILSQINPYLGTVEPLKYKKIKQSFDNGITIQENLTLDDVRDHREKRRYDIKYISSIESDNIKVVFNHGSTRIDLPNTPFLEEIRVLDNRHSKLIKDYKLNYIYSSQSITCPNAENKNRFRLFLNTIEELPNYIDLNLSPQKHQLIYNPTNLPCRFSKEQDFWGYYNDNNSTTLVPKIYAYPEFYRWDTYRITPMHPSWYNTEYILNGADRSVNPNAITAGTLEKIIFPTGGYRKYEFESNQYYDQMAKENINGGGLRIKSIEHADGLDINYPIKREYKYHREQDALKSSGKLTYPPIFAQDTNYYLLPGEIYPSVVKFSDYAPYEQNTWVGSEQEEYDLFTKRTSHSLSPTQDINGQSVFYNNVHEEIYPNGGSLSYTFSSSKTMENSLVISQDARINGCNNCDFLVDYGWAQFYGNSGNQLHDLDRIRRTNQTTAPYPPLSDLNLSTHRLGGKLRKKVIYNSNTDTLRLEKYHYTNIDGVDPEDVYGIKISNYDVVTADPGIELPAYAYLSPIYHLMVRGWSTVAKYKYRTNTDAVLTKKETWDYSLEASQESLKAEENYEYLPNSKLVKYIEKITPTTKTKEIFRYIPEITGDYSSPNSTNVDTRAFWRWKEKNRISTPLQYTKYNNLDGEKVLSGQITLPMNHLYFPSTNSGNYIGEVRTLERSDDNNTGNLSIDMDGLEDELYIPIEFKKNFEVLDFDEDGNILEFKKEHGIHNSIIWGYHNRYPIVKIEGASYSEIEDVVNNLKSLSDNDIDDNSELIFLTELKELRNQYPNFLITTYTYDPLIGVTSITPPNGLTQYYTYDGFGRLKEVKDEQGNILSENEYHYRP